MNKLPELHRLDEMFYYDAIDGVLRWKKSPASNVRAGSVAGHKTERGEKKVRLDGRLYLVHRIVWKKVNRQEPEGIIDHINLDPTDNRIENLRLATVQLNGANSMPRSKTGAKGVMRSDTLSDRYYAQITVGRKRIYLGAFGSIEAASNAYQEAARSHFGEFARW